MDGISELKIRTRRRRPFSLIELLIVMAILAILIAMLMPSLHRARKKARSLVCMANLRQSGLAMAIWYGDHNRKFPGGNATIQPIDGIDSTYRAWSATPIPYGLAYLLVDQYIDNASARIFYCPLWRHPINQYNRRGDDLWLGVNGYGGWPATGQPGPINHRGISYAYRSTFGSGFNEAPSLNGPTGPSTTAYVTDHFVRREVLYGVDYGHGDEYNTLYLDGHTVTRRDQNYRMITLQPTMTNTNWSLQESIWLSFFNQ